MNTKTETKKAHNPFVRIVKRERLPFRVRIWFYVIAIFFGLLVTSTLVILSSSRDKNYIDFFAAMFSGAFGTERRFWIFVQDFSLLLGVSIALLPVFKMRFWNLGGNGQILIGAMVATIVMFYWGGKMPDPVLWILMFILASSAAAVWAVIPAIFRVFFKTNESLFTLMLNYIAMVLVKFLIAFWYPTGSGAMKPIEVGGLPSLGEGKMGIALMCFTLITIITVAVIIHLVFSKRGYEIAVIGESERTAKYIGINVKWRTILTAFMSGAICGVVGVLLSGLINHTVSTTMDANMGFTGIMVDWLSRFDPSAIAPVAFLITLLNKGIGQVNTEFGFASQATNSVITGLIYFFVISVTFYTRYKVRFRSDIEEKMKKVTTPIANFFKRIFSRKKKEEVK